MTDQNRALATLSPAAAPLARALDLDPERMALLCRTLGDGLKPDEVQLFLAVSARTGLDPFLKQIYAIKSNGRFFIHVGIDGRRLIGQRTGQVDGTRGPEWCGADGAWRDVWLDDAPPAAARFGILKKGCREPFWAVARYRSFKTNNPNWIDRPDHMLAKVAEDHAWRKAFPYEMGGLPSYHPENDQAAGADESPGVLSAATDEAEWREVDHETGEIIETPRPAAAPDAGGRPHTPQGSTAPAVDGAAARGQQPPATEPADELEQTLAEHAARSRPAWWDTDLGRAISSLVDQLDAAGLRYSLPADEATQEDLEGWIAAKKGLLKQRGAR